MIDPAAIAAYTSGVLRARAAYYHEQDHPMLDPDTARVLAGDLLRDLTRHVGDPQQVDARLHHWFGELDPLDFGLVCIAAVRTAFTECMTPIERSPAA